MAKERTVSGMRPTGPLHIGHYFGALKNWVAMQEEMESFFFVADWHALTSDYADTTRLREYVREMVLDWLSVVTFPMEARFEDVNFARKAYGTVVRRIIDSGVRHTAAHRGHRR